MPEDRLYRSMLLDFYGELLTSRQRECYELHYNEDLSLSEIAEQCGISRQGAWDNIRRASEAMEEVEEKTGLLQRFYEIENGLRRLMDILTAAEKAAAEGRPSDGLLREAASGIRELLRTDPAE